MNKRDTETTIMAKVATMNFQINTLEHVLEQMKVQLKGLLALVPVDDD